MSNFDSDKPQKSTPDSDPAELFGPARSSGTAGSIPPVVANPLRPQLDLADGIHFLSEATGEFASRPVDSPVNSPVKPPVKPTGKPTGHPVVAWCIIVALVTLIVVKPFPQDREQEQGTAGEGTTLAAKMMEIQGKYLVGASQLPPLSGEDLFQHAKPLNTGPLESRFRFVVLAGELAGPEEAREQLDELQQRIDEHHSTTTADQEEIQQLLGRLYSDYASGNWDAPSLNPRQRELLKSRLGWFGSLALAPRKGLDSAARQTVLEPAKRTVIVLVPAVLLLILFGAFGLVGLTTFVAQVAGRRIRSRLNPGSWHGAIYAETFAAWLVLFLLLEIAAALVANQDNMLLVNLVVFFLSLSALAWPVLRGIPWRRVRRDIGLTLGKHPLSEPLWGLVCYASTLPLLLVGVVIMVMIIGLAGLFAGGGAEDVDEFESAELPSHPVIEWISEADWSGRLLIVLLACVAAPIVEEIVFRGVLYRHLRDSTAAWRIGLSVLFSSATASFIFAVIHPQGVVAVPALMSLAIGFSLAREWRGSLIAPMTMHSVNNAVVTMLMFAIV